MNGLENDLNYLEKVIENVNNGERNYSSIKGIVIRLENSIKKLDENYIPHSKHILRFNHLINSIKEPKLLDIEKDLGKIVNKIKDKKNSSLLDICEMFDDVRKKIKLIDVKNEALKLVEHKINYLRETFYKSDKALTLFIEEADSLFVKGGK